MRREEPGGPASHMWLSCACTQVLWSYLPRLSEFSEIPVLDPGLEETDSQVGQFSVGLLVGKGHFAEVKVCSLASDERRLVIKAIDKQRVKNVNGLQRISHEIEALKILRHPNILSLYSVLHGQSVSQSSVWTPPLLQPCITNGASRLTWRPCCVLLWWCRQALHVPGDRAAVLGSVRVHRRALQRRRRGAWARHHHHPLLATSLCAPACACAPHLFASRGRSVHGR